MTKTRPPKIPAPLPIGRRRVQESKSTPELLHPAHNLAVLLDYWHRLSQTMLDSHVDESQPQNDETLPQNIGLARQFVEILPTIRAWASRLNPAETELLFDALWLAGVAADLEADLQYGRKFATGDSVMRGGKDGFKKAHGSYEERLAKREQLMSRFGQLRRKFPDAAKKVLLGMIQEETGASKRTLERFIKDR